MSTTPISLLDRLRDEHSQNDWVRFAELYSPLLLFWARQFGLQEADAADLTQDTLVRAWRDINGFRSIPGKRFRGWLWTIARNRFLELARERRPPLIDPNQAISDKHDGVRELVESEYNAYLVNRALALMKNEFEASTWQACWATVVESRNAGEVATSLGITVNAVYLAKARVLRRLREELAGLLD